MKQEKDAKNLYPAGWRLFKSERKNRTIEASEEDTSAAEHRSNAAVGNTTPQDIDGLIFNKQL